MIAEPVTGGVEVPYGAYDTLLGVYCDPQNYSDETVRCVPRTSELRVLSERQWADTAKTIPVTLEPLAQPAAQGTLAGHFGYKDACWSVSLELWRVGAPRQGTFYVGEFGGLKTVPAGYGLYDLTPVPSDFVELNEQLALLSGTTAARELHGSDGSRLFVNDLYDLAHDTPVWVTPTTSTEYRLLPPAIGRLDYRRTMPATTNDCHDPQDFLFSRVDGRHCDVSALRYVSGGNAVYQVAAQFGSLWHCYYSDAPVQIGFETFGFLGACGTVPVTDWTLVPRITVGGGRLTADAYAIGSAPYVKPTSSWTFADTSLGISCTPRLARDGALRCLPVFNLGDVYYSDPACTSRVVVSGFPTPPTYAEEGSRSSATVNGLEGNITVYSVGAPRASAPTYARTLGGCELQGNLAGFEIGPEVPASTFAPLTIRDVP